MCHALTLLIVRDYNPIEGCFSISKAFIKKERLRAIVQKRKMNLPKLILRSFDQLDKAKCKKFVDYSFRKLKEN